MHILFHPDYDRRLWRLTRSARPPKIGALAGSWITNSLGSTYRRWGISPRPENIRTIANFFAALQYQKRQPKDQKMHPNPIFHDADAAQNLAFARERAFGVLSVNGDDGPLLSHIPFVLSAQGDVVDLHLVRSNPIVRRLKLPLRAKIAVSGGDSYVSPDWYGIEDQVPTWNYVAVHLAGELEQRPQEELRDLLDRQSAFFEDQLEPKPPWLTDKMTPEALDKMMRQIVPCRFTVTGVDGTWKLSQNKPDAVRIAAAEGVAAYGIGTDQSVLAALMRGAK